MVRRFPFSVSQLSHMSNLATALKEEISRLVRKEMKADLDVLRKASSRYRSDLAALKRQIAQLERRCQQLERRSQQAPQTRAQPTGKDALSASGLRFSGKGLRTLRDRHDLSAAALGKLIGVSGATVFNWESGKSRPKPAQLSQIAVLRRMGKKGIDALRAATP